MHASHPRPHARSHQIQFEPAAAAETLAAIHEPPEPQRLQGLLSLAGLPSLLRGAAPCEVILAASLRGEGCSCLARPSPVLHRPVPHEPLAVLRL
jgi:hypothetical protein